MIVSLGAFTLHLLVKIGGHEADPGTVDAVAQFVARHALWFFAVPIVYAACGNMFAAGREALPLKVAGFVLCAILLVVFGIPLRHYLL